MTEPELKVAVVVPAYNAETTIRDCIASLTQQTVRPSKIVVIDDCSNVPLGGILGKRSDVEIKKLQRRSGAGKARATGAGMCRCDVIAFLDSDCIAPSDWLQKIVAIFQENPDLGAVGGSYSHSPPEGPFETLAGLEEKFVHQILAQHPTTATLPAGNMACRKIIWDKAYVGREEILFAGIASGEDVIVSANLRKIAPTLFAPSLQVFHASRQASGYFRRHFARGLSGMIQILSGVSGEKPSSLDLYGGSGLLLSSAALGGAIPAFLCAVYFHTLLVPLGSFGAILLLLHFVLGKDFFKFAEEFSTPKLTRATRLLIHVLLFARTLCWVFGASVAILRGVKDKLHFYREIIFSILHFWKPKALSKLFFFVTSQCNARCEFCFNLDNVEAWKARKVNELSLREISKVSQSLERLPCLTLSGGEPFLRKDLSQIIHVFHKNAKTRWVTIPTNASLTKAVINSTREILTLCPGIFLTVQISLDSLGDDHNASRKISGGFESILNTMERLGQLRLGFPNLRIQIATCYGDFNIERIDEILDFSREHFSFDQYFLYMLRDDGKLITDSDKSTVVSFLNHTKAIDARELADRPHGLWARAVRALQKITYEDTLEIKLHQKFLRACSAGQRFATLYDDGTVCPCEVLSNVSYGNIRDTNYDLVKLLAQDQAKSHRLEKVRNGKCSCDWMCALPINMLYDFKTYLRIARAVIFPGK